MRLMTDRRIRHVPVVEADGRLCGMISIGDVVKQRLDDIQGEADALREYVTSALGLGKPFLLYETPQAPHWAEISNPDGTTSRLAVPEPKYASTPVGTCSGVREPDRSDKPAYVRNSSFSQASAQLARMQALYSVGRAAQADLLQAQAFEADAQLTLSQGQTQQAVAEERLRTTIHAPLEEKLTIGDRVVLNVPHCDPTADLYDSYHVVQGDTLVGIWPVSARGRSR